MLEVKGTKVKVTAWQSISSKNVISQERISWSTSKLVKIILARGATC